MAVTMTADPLRAFLNTPADPDLDTDEKLSAAGWATGLHVLTTMFDAYSDSVGNETVTHAQVRSLLAALSGVAWRGSQTEAWIKRHRDDWDDGTEPKSPAWFVIDNLLDDYRNHSDVGTPLSEDIEGPEGS